MDVKIFIIFVLITTVQCRFNRDGRKASSNAAAANQQHERERRHLTSEQYALQNQPSYAPTEASPETKESLHFEKEIKEAKDAMSIMIGYIALTFLLVTIISCCCIACTVITVAFIWSSRETPNNNKKEQQQPQVVQSQYPPPQPWLLPPPRQFYDGEYFQEIYKGEPRIYPVVSRTDIYASDSRPKVYRSKPRPKVRSIASRSSVYPSDS
uniref:Uncharacterized protein n=1 Tax=Panagrolaimus sp. PS1159 TaxID=55785 RepID=A0AC35GMD5_9BILA